MLKTGGSIGVADGWGSKDEHIRDSTRPKGNCEEEGVTREVGDSASLARHANARGVYAPEWSYGDVDSLVAQNALEIAGRPRLGGRPGGSTLPHHERRVPRDVAHELERAGLCVQFFNGRTVELLVVVKKLRHGVCI